MARRLAAESKRVQQQKLAKGRRPTAVDYLADMRQTDSASKRGRAIMAFGKALRREDRFQTTWETVGGAEGVAALMAMFSVKDVRSMCRWLGRTASAINARPQRRAALAELVKVLDNGEYDVRPLRAYYQDIVPACPDGVVQEVQKQPDVEWSGAQQKGLLMGHREQHEKKFLEDAFAPNGRRFSFAEKAEVFVGNHSFSEKILQTLLVQDTNTVRIPGDFMSDFVLPLLKRLLRRTHEVMRARMINLVVDCVVRHSKHLASALRTNSPGLLLYIMERWFNAAGSKREHMEACLTRLLAVYPSKPFPLTLHEIYMATYKLKKMSPEQRYYLIRLFIRHLPYYGVDIEDESPANMTRLKELRELQSRGSSPNLWPSKIFTTIDNASALPLFERLAGIFPAGDFLRAPVYDTTVLRQTRALNEDIGDLEIARGLLRQKSANSTKASEWLAEAREAVEERKKMAAQSREPRERAFWAKSAFHLSVATGDLKLLKEVIVWARRFRRDSLTTHELFQADVLKTPELAEILCGIPEFKNKAEAVKAGAAVSIESISENIQLANAVLLVLTDSAVLDVSEPGFQRHRWDILLGLPKSITRERLRRSKSFGYIAQMNSTEDPEVRLKETVWKPTIETLIEIEKHLRDPAAAPILLQNSVMATGADVMLWLEDPTAKALAEMAQFVMLIMQDRLGSEIIKTQINNIVSIILRVSRSDQPTLACPFIRQIILKSESDNSSWHRRLVNRTFLKSLPAENVREFLQTMADAMRDAMKAQNATRTQNQGVKPAIKVSTIKMFAQLLQGNVFVSPVDACNMLTSLLSVANHIDARLSIITALMSILTEPKATLELRQLVLESIETHAVPVMGQLSERRQVSEEEWEAAAKNSLVPLPDVGEDALLMGMLMDEAAKAKLHPEDRLRIVELITIAFEQSAVNNMRWHNLFLARNGVSLDAEERLPHIPVKADLLLPHFAQRWILYMPKTIIDMVRQLVLLEVDPPAYLTKIAETVRGNSKLIMSPAGKHWVTQFDRLVRLGVGLECIIDAAKEPPVSIESKPGDQEGVYVETLHELILTAAERLIRRGETSLLLQVAQRITRNRLARDDQWERYQTICVPIVRDIIAVIEDIRQQSTSASDRPPVLPNTFQLKVMILPLPRAGEYDQDRYQSFVSAVEDLISELSTRRLPYHEDFALVVSEVTRSPMRKHLATLALMMARLDEVKAEAEPSLEAYLRLELVAECIMNANPEEQAVQDELAKLLETWKVCQAEGLRNLYVKIEDRVSRGWLNDAKKRRAAAAL